MSLGRVPTSSGEFSAMSPQKSSRLWLGSSVVCIWVKKSRYTAPSPRCFTSSCVRPLPSSSVSSAPMCTQGPGNTCASSANQLPISERDPASPATLPGEDQSSLAPGASTCPCGFSPTGENCSNLSTWCRWPGLLLGNDDDV